MLHLYKFCHRSIIDRPDTAVAIIEMFFYRPFVASNLRGWFVPAATWSPHAEIQDEDVKPVVAAFDKVNEHRRICCHYVCSETHLQLVTPSDLKMSSSYLECPPGDGPGRLLPVFDPTWCQHGKESIETPSAAIFDEPASLSENNRKVMCMWVHLAVKFSVKEVKKIY